MGENERVNDESVHVQFFSLSFSYVYRGRWNNGSVALKALKNDNLNGLIEEIRHAHEAKAQAIVRIFGKLWLLCYVCFVVIVLLISDSSIFQVSLLCMVPFMLCWNCVRKVHSRNGSSPVR
jgi:hypothetical protein